MSDITDGLGTAVEGGLLAQAVEGPDNSASNGGHGSCLNCGTGLAGPHCHQCGQKGAVHRSLGAIGHEILHGVLHLDGKIWRTLPLLAWKPGELTRRYIEGERAKFVGPMAMFLFSVFLMFAVFQMVGLTAPSDIRAPDVSETVEKLGEQAQSQLKTAQARVDALPEGSADRAQAEEDLASARTIVDSMSDADKFTLGANAAMSFDGTGVEWIDENLINKWRENPGLMLYKLQTNAYKFSWLLIPISLPFVWSLFFWKRRFKAYDHAIFVTYSIAAMSLLFIVLSVLTAVGIGGGWVFTALAILPPIHIYRQLRGTYELSRFGALVRTILLLLMIFFGISLLFVWAMIALGAF